MTLRLQDLMLAMLFALTALFVGMQSLSQSPASGGYQLFERAASGISADIQLGSLGNFAPSPETVSEYANAPNRLPCCFIAGTPVKTTNGYTDIENLAVGDEVLSQNVETGAIETNVVIETHVRPISEIDTFYKLTVGTENSSEVLFVTGEHPFWVADRQEWITVDDIEVGAQLINHQGEALSVLGKVLQTELQQTYNITVAGNNNYFAGRLETLVHNCGPDDLIKISTPAGGSGSTRNFDRSGGFQQANADFDALSLTNVRTIPIGSGGTGRVGTLPDGRNVVVRPTSTTGSPTLEIQGGSQGGNRVTKFRY